MFIQGGTDWLTAGSDHTQAVVLKISEAVGAPLKELHFPMEAFGHAIVFGEQSQGIRESRVYGAATALSTGRGAFLWGLSLLGDLVKHFITSDSKGVKDAQNAGILSPMSPTFDQDPTQGAYPSQWRHHKAFWLIGFKSYFI